MTAGFDRLATLLRQVRRSSRTSLMLAGEGWIGGPLVALVAAPLDELRVGGSAARLLARLDQTVADRRRNAKAGGTGVAVLLDHEALGPLAPREEADPAGPALAVVLAVDATVRCPSFAADGFELASVPGLDAGASLERLAASDARAPARPARIIEPARTSLPRLAYLKAVERVREHIARGDVYQANLCQRFTARHEGELCETWIEAVRSTRAPLAAWVETGDASVASLSPETFLIGRADGEIETRPIKGTRARGATAEEDRRAAEDLVRSAKDRAELTMIVDLERNDLSRVCTAGTVEVPEPGTLHSFPAVHHLIARVRGRLRPGTPPSDVLRATFPGGSISGAPKRRALEILRELEPVRRGFFTGSLLWFDDDGTLSSSLLIRTLVADREGVQLGAGGGIVADSDPEAEWHESNTKARPLARALGFDPEEAT